jgi:hypothetical protein
MDLKDKKLLQSLSLYTTEKSGNFAKMLSKHNKTQETFIPLNLNAKHTPIVSDNLRNKIVDFNAEYIRDKKIINKLEKDTKDFSIGYNLVTEKGTTNKQKKTEKILGEEILYRYKLQGYDIKNMFPKENIFQKSLLLEPDNKKFIRIMKNLTDEDLEFENNYCDKLKKTVKLRNTLDKYQKKKVINNNNSTTTGDLETNFSLDEIDNIEDYKLFKYFKNINSKTIKKQIIQLKKDIKKTNSTLNQMKPKKINNPIKLYEMNNNLIKNKKDKSNNFRSAFINYNNNTPNNNDNLLKSLNTTTTNETKNSKEIKNRRASSIIPPINFIRKKIPTIIKNTKVQTNFDVKHFENLTKNIEIKKKQEYEEQLERQRIKDLKKLYKNIKHQSFEKSDYDINNYLTLYKRPFPKKFIPSEGSNLNGLLTKFVNFTSYHNFPERIYNLKTKFGHRNKNEKIIEKEVETDKKINTLEYDYVDDILKLNENLK